jgi:ABC-2 type transport system permease protein
MNTMKWLLRREFWEHKGAFFWAPVVVAAAMVVLLGGAALYGVASGHAASITVDGDRAITLGAAIDTVTPEMRADLVRVATSNYLAIASPLFLVMGVVLFFYCLSALYDDRRDRSILFWKSLPLSDEMTVASKVATAVGVVPLITIGIATVMSLAFLLIGAVAAAMHGMKLFGLLFTSINLYLGPLYLLALLPVYALWALPTVGWLLMVSAWARSKVFLWAVGIPVVTAVLLKWLTFLIGQFSGRVISIEWFIDNVVERILFGLVPGVWLDQIESPQTLLGSMNHGIEPGMLVAQSWITLAAPGVWAGVLLGGAMIYAAIRLRRWRDEG